MGTSSGELNGHGAWKVITPPRIMPEDLGEIKEYWADDLEAEMRTVAALVLSDSNRLFGKSGLRRQSEDLTEEGELDIVISKSGPALAKALSDPGHDCSNEEVGFSIQRCTLRWLESLQPRLTLVKLASIGCRPLVVWTAAAIFHLESCWRAPECWGRRVLRIAGIVRQRHGSGSQLPQSVQ
jgi:hypothetical protein